MNDSDNLEETCTNILLKTSQEQYNLAHELKLAYSLKLILLEELNNLGLDCSNGRGPNGSYIAYYKCLNLLKTWSTDLAPMST